MSGETSLDWGMKHTLLGIAKLPFTMIFLIIMIATNFAAGTLGGDLPDQSLRHWGISHNDIVLGEVYRLITGTFLSHDVAMFMRQVCFAAAVIGYYEWTQGTLRALGMFVLIDIVGSLIVLFAVLAPLSGAPWAGLDGITSVHDVGMSAGGFGLIGAIVATSKYRSVLMLAVLASIAVKVMFQFDAIADTAHVVTLLIGFALQWVWFERRPDHAG